jgi:hypothetical protein
MMEDKYSSETLITTCKKGLQYETENIICSFEIFITTYSIGRYLQPPTRLWE